MLALTSDTMQPVQMLLAEANVSSFRTTSYAFTLMFWRPIQNLKPSCRGSQLLSRIRSKFTLCGVTARKISCSFCSLCLQERSVHSQNGEDGIIESLFGWFGTRSKFYVEFGVEEGDQCNTRLLRERRSWTGSFKLTFLFCSPPLSNI